MTAEYVRNYYKVPAKRGMGVTVDGRPGVIVSFPGQYIGVRFVGDKHTSRCHPTWEVVYINPAPPAARETRLYRIKVTSWPTPDGKPFTAQPAEFWERLQDAYFDPSDDNPLPPGFNGNWPPIEDYCFDDYRGEPHFTKPAFKRRQYLAKRPAVAQMERMEQWGIVCELERSKPVEFE